MLSKHCSRSIRKHKNILFFILIAYAAVLYIKNVTKNSTRLIVAKIGVAPLKESENALTIPRLELCAAWLLAKLAKKTMDALEIPFEIFFMWSDSKIVLDWINPIALSVAIWQRLLVTVFRRKLKKIYTRQQIQLERLFHDIKTLILKNCEIMIKYCQKISLKNSRFLVPPWKKNQIAYFRRKIQTLGDPWKK